MKCFVYQEPHSSPELSGVARSPPQRSPELANFPRSAPGKHFEHAEPRKYVEFHCVFQDLGLDPNQDQMMRETISAEMSTNPR